MKTPTYFKAMDMALLVLRVFQGAAMFFGHGLKKWEQLFSGDEIIFADPLGIGMLPSLVLAVFTEVICAALLIIGLLTRAVLIPLILTMLVAIFIVHIADGFDIMEKALLYGIGFITLWLTGPGNYSVDYFLIKSKENIT